MADISFKIKYRLRKARTGIIKVPHGIIHTPAFMPVATKGTVKTLTSEQMNELGAELLMCNTYHLMLQPGIKVVKKFGGLHRFMNWNKPIMTDSAGFQAFSLGYGKEHSAKKIGYFPGNKEVNQRTHVKKLASIDDEGVRFTSVYNDEKKHLTPEESIKIQEVLGSDMMIAFDECTSCLSSYKYVKESLERTNRWAARCVDAHKTRQALFGVIQGGNYKNLRIKASRFISAQKFDGYCIGGNLGKSKKDMHKIIGWCVDELPDNKPRHLLGIGAVEDLFEAVERGIDLFDCVGPTRLARSGYVFISPKAGGNLGNKYRIRIKSSKYEFDKKPIDPYCQCAVCRGHSRAFIRHLFRAPEFSAYSLATYHNLYFVLDLMRQIRNSIENDELDKLKRKWV